MFFSFACRAIHGGKRKKLPQMYDEEYLPNCQMYHKNARETTVSSFNEDADIKDVLVVCQWLAFYPPCGQ